MTNYIEGVHKIKVEKNNLIKLINILKKVHLYKFNGGGKINPQNHKGSKTNWHSHISTTIKKLNFSNFKKITMEAKKLTETEKAGREEHERRIEELKAKIKDTEKSLKIAKIRAKSDHSPFGVGTPFRDSVNQLSTKIDVMNVELDALISDR